jgi:hypothetical protein
MPSSGAAAVVISNPVASELTLPEIRTGQCPVPTMLFWGKETALPCPLLLDTGYYVVFNPKSHIQNPKSVLGLNRIIKRKRFGIFRLYKNSLLRL